MLGKVGSVGLLCLVACGGNSLSTGAAGGAPSGGAVNDSDGAGAGSAGASSAGTDSGGVSSAGTANGGASNAGGASGGVSNAGAASGGVANAGGSAQAMKCTPGEVRCRTVRERCSETGDFQPEDFVCAIDITGAKESAMACAVKSDGQMTCFGTSMDYLVPKLLANAPAGNWTKLFLADDPAEVSNHQLCGLQQSGSGTCWGSDGSKREVSGTRVANGSNGLCLLDQNGAWFCPEDQGLTGPKSSDGDQLLDLQIRSSMLFALKRDGSVRVPYPNYDLPSGTYTRISAGNLEFCALREDHTLVCAIHAPPSAFASQRFVDLSVEYWGGLCALREDQTLVCDAMGTSVSFGTPPTGKFTRIEAIGRGMCGIRVDGSIACFGENELAVPAGW